MRGGRRRAGGNVVYLGKMLTTRTGVTARWLRWIRVAWVYGADPFTGEIVRDSHVLVEHQEDGTPLPRPPPLEEVERARLWAEAHPIDAIRTQNPRTDMAV
jgi:hypothetical protein